MIRTQIQLHSEQIQWLKKYALEKGISMSQAIRDSIDTYRADVTRIRELNTKKQWDARRLRFQNGIRSIKERATWAVPFRIPYACNFLVKFYLKRTNGLLWSPVEGYLIPPSPE